MCGGLPAMKRKVLQVLAFFLGIFIVISGAMLISPMFDGVLDKVNGVVFFIFAFFIFRYALTGQKQ